MLSTYFIVMYHKGKKNYLMGLLACGITLKLCHWIPTSFFRSPGWDKNSVGSMWKIRLRNNAGKYRVWPFLWVEKAPATSAHWESRHKWKCLEGGGKKHTQRDSKTSSAVSIPYQIRNSYFKPALYTYYVYVNIGDISISHLY